MQGWVQMKEALLWFLMFTIFQRLIYLTNCWKWLLISAPVWKLSELSSCWKMKNRRSMHEKNVIYEEEQQQKKPVSPQKPWIYQPLCMRRANVSVCRLRECVFVLALQPDRLSALSSLPRRLPQVTPVKRQRESVRSEIENENEGRRGKKERFHRFQRDSTGLRSSSTPHPSVITLPKKTFTYG